MRRTIAGEFPSSAVSFYCLIVSPLFSLSLSLSLPLFKQGNKNSPFAVNNWSTNFTTTLHLFTFLGVNGSRLEYPLVCDGLGHMCACACINFLSECVGAALCVFCQFFYFHVVFFVVVLLLLLSCVCGAAQQPNPMCTAPFRHCCRMNLSSQ